MKLRGMQTFALVFWVTNKTRDRNVFLSNMEGKVHLAFAICCARITHNNFATGNVSVIEFAL